MKTSFVDFFTKYDISPVSQDISNLIDYRYEFKPHSVEFGQKLESSYSEIWFHHVILQADGSHADDPKKDV